VTWFRYVITEVCKQQPCVLLGLSTIDTQVSKDNIYPPQKKTYEHYFGCPVGDKRPPWAPHVCCSTRALDYRAWLRETRHATPVPVLVV
jgi:hypothetical protein